MPHRGGDTQVQPHTVESTGTRAGLAPEPGWHQKCADTRARLAPEMCWHQSRAGIRIHWHQNCANTRNPLASEIGGHQSRANTRCSQGLNTLRTALPTATARAMLAPEPAGAAFFPYQPFSRNTFPIVSPSFSCNHCYCATTSLRLASGSQSAQGDCSCPVSYQGQWRTVWPGSPQHIDRK